MIITHLNGSKSLFKTLNSRNAVLSTDYQQTWFCIYLSFLRA